MPRGGSPARLAQVVRRIEELHDRIRADVAANPARKGRERGQNLSLRIRHKIGRFVNEFVAMHKEAFGRGNNAVRALSGMLGGSMSTTDLYSHSKYAGFDKRAVESHVRQGLPWRKACQLKLGRGRRRPGPGRGSAETGNAR